MNLKVVTTGLGVVTSLGQNLEDTWAGLMAGECGARPLTRFNTELEGIPWVGAVAPEALSHHPCATASLSLHASIQALEMSGLEKKHLGRAACILGTSVGGMAESEVAYAEYRLNGKPIPTEVMRHHPAQASAQIVAQRLGLGGRVTAVATACSSGAGALLFAQQLIRTGRADVVLAGGADPLCRLTMDGFTALKVVDSERSRPFDAHRSGLNLGEGSGMLVLESEDHARRRGAHILGRLVGASNTCDAFHGTAPHPEGRGVKAAFRACLAQAGISTHDVTYINAHGTGTKQNDLTEGESILDTFGSEVPVSSVKGAIGHTLGASGGIEAVLCVKTLLEGMAPPSVGCREPELKNLNVIIKPTPIDRDGYVLSNSFAFGGNNACLLLARGDA